MTVLARGSDHVLHQLPADAFALSGEVDGDWSDAGHLAPHVDEVRAFSGLSVVRADAVDVFLRDEHADDLLRELDGREVAWETVAVREVLECLVADASQLGNVVRV